jgi:hypothetical protein
VRPIHQRGPDALPLAAGRNRDAPNMQVRGVDLETQAPDRVRPDPCDRAAMRLQVRPHRLDRFAEGSARRDEDGGVGLKR